MGETARWMGWGMSGEWWAGAGLSPSQDWRSLGLPQPRVSQGTGQAATFSHEGSPERVPGGRAARSQLPAVSSRASGSLSLPDQKV